MKIEQLRQLLEVSKTGSINRAAANLYISQPNLSASLRALEEELGYALLDRSSRGVTLTVDGERFLEYARSVLEQFDHLSTLRSPVAGTETSLSIANARYRYVVEAAAALHANHRRETPFRLTIEEGSREQVLDAVSRDRCEIGIVGLWNRYKREVVAQFKARDCQYFRLTSNPVTVVVGQGNPLFHAPADTVVTPEVLAEHCLVRYDNESFGSARSMELLRSANCAPGEIVVNSRAALYEVLDHTDAYTIASTNRQAYTHAKYYPYARSFVLQMDGGACEVGWIKRKDHTPSPLAMEFLQILTGYYG